MLGESFALAEGFTLHFVLSPAPREARAFLAALAEQAEPGDRRRLEIADPYVAWAARATTPNTPLTIDDLETEMLRGLLRLDTLAVADARALVLDASCTHPHDLPAWRFAFARLNEARNAVMLRLPTNIVLVLDAAMGREAIFTAPDVWSVRTNQISLSGQTRAVEPSAWQREASDELMYATATLRSAAVDAVRELATSGGGRRSDWSAWAREDWVSEDAAPLLANPTLAPGLLRIPELPLTPWPGRAPEPQWRRPARAVFDELAVAVRTLDWSVIDAMLEKLAAASPPAALRESVYMLVAYEAFARSAFVQAEAWFAQAMQSVAPEGGYPMLFPRLGRCLACASLGRIEEARALFFALEAYAWSGESLAAESLFETRGAELYRLFGDERRALLAAALGRGAVR